MLVTIGLWLARLGGWQEPVPPVPEPHECQIIIPPGFEEMTAMRSELTTLRSLCHQHQTESHGLRRLVQQQERDLASSRDALPLNTPTIRASLLERARELVHEAEEDTKYTKLSGEAKRHAVYARLQKDFPGTPKRELSLAIELVLHTP